MPNTSGFVLALNVVPRILHTSEDFKEFCASIENIPDFQNMSIHDLSQEKGRGTRLGKLLRISEIRHACTCLIQLWPGRVNVVELISCLAQPSQAPCTSASCVLSCKAFEELVCALEGPASALVCWLQKCATSWTQGMRVRQQADMTIFGRRMQSSVPRYKVRVNVKNSLQIL